MGRKKEPRRKRTRTSPTVHRLRMSVAVAPPSTEQEATSIRVDREIRLLKTAMLYADDVELMSPVVELIEKVQQFHGLDSDGFLRVLSQGDLDDARWWGLDVHDEDQWQGLSQLMRDPQRTLDDWSKQLRGRRDVDQSELEEVMAGMRHTVSHVLPNEIARMQAELERQAEETRFSELRPLLATGRLQLRTAGGATSGNGDAVVTQMLAVLRRAAADPARYLLTDEVASGLIQGMLERGDVVIPTMAEKHARRAQMNSGLVDAMPTLPHARLNDILQIRDDLADPLARYRQAVAELTDQIRTSPYDYPAMASEVEDAWITNIAPALEDVRQAMRGNGVVKAMKKDPAKVIAAAAAGGVAVASTVWFGWLPSPETLQPIIDASSAAVGAAAQVGVQRSRDRRHTSQMRFYFLQEADRRAQTI